MTARGIVDGDPRDRHQRGLEARRIAAREMAHSSSGIVDGDSGIADNGSRDSGDSGYRA